MKNKLFFLLTILSLFMYSCGEEESIGQQALDSIPPGQVSNVEIINTPGGALITYSTPVDEDLLYIKAVYSRREGEISESKASQYADTLVIEGFGSTIERQVQLVSVDRSRNESEPVNVTIAPLEPPVNTIAASLDIIEDFGGITSTWFNEDKAEISIVLQEVDTLLNEFVPLETYYSSAQEGKFSIYGLDTIPRNIQAFIQDRWENRSPIKDYTITPLYETEFEKSKFALVNLPGDGPHHNAWVPSNIWNGTAEPNGYSSQGGQGIWPQSITIDLGVIGRLSRIKVYQRKEIDAYVYAEGNLKRFEVWGAETIDLSGNWDSWTKLGDFESIKPSGLPFGQFSDEDKAVAYNGEDFSFLSSNPKIRYIRILVKETWAGGDNFQIMELDIFGDNR
ncbi:DUF5000 domain-containing lipoprotein [Flavivirga sp. 57AJ16]|uniref:DUF5000 domain-containing lipoprotein n=1 Tax=Flavivirga sp. 57AJ16 TaxID=3025307 RepID=UPI00236515F1|nr:DUF5000 domain-containing lipoprotein [Flavivirga sp. 57AJ16]MDD7885135.1 DUF5000 domain-containing lipoprotein [Flavivirga sp. 57AJ16]